jgi:riboflavin kinase/FMN adenylyltransferase
MEVIRLSYPLEPGESRGVPSQVIAIGDFDGIHLGHQAVIRKALDMAKELDVPASIMTFYPHPREVLGQAKYTRILTPLQDKMEFFQKMGVHHTYVVDFNAHFMQIRPEQFVESVLLPLQLDTVVVGFDFTFGHKAEGTPATLGECSRGRFAVVIVPPYRINGEKVSSTRVRNHLLAGEIEEANTLLGRPFAISGTVVSGRQRGRTIGFPTANVEPNAAYVLPRNGVYAVRLRMGDAIYDGVMNIGVKPTFEGDGLKLTLEVHIFDFAGDIYGRYVTVELLSFIRPEQKFASVEELKEQIQRDTAHCRQKLACL